MQLPFQGPLRLPMKRTIAELGRIAMKLIFLSVIISSAQFALALIHPHLEMLGSILAPSAVIDSVDNDDGTIDG
jgi:hypothetical protein